MICLSFSWINKNLKIIIFGICHSYSSKITVEVNITAQTCMFVLSVKINKTINWTRITTCFPF